MVKICRLYYTIQKTILESEATAQFWPPYPTEFFASICKNNKYIFCFIRTIPNTLNTLEIVFNFKNDLYEMANLVNDLKHTRDLKKV